jgi:hypothetical protein
VAHSKSVLSHGVVEFALGGICDVHPLVISYLRLLDLNIEYFSIDGDKQDEIAAADLAFFDEMALPEHNLCLLDFLLLAFMVLSAHLLLALPEARLHHGFPTLNPPTGQHPGPWKRQIFGSFRC